MVTVIKTTTDLIAADISEEAWELFDAFYFALRFQGYVLADVPFDDDGKLMEYDEQGTLHLTSGEQ